MTFTVAKDNCLGCQPDVKQSFLATFSEIKICNYFSLYSKCVKKRRKICERVNTIKFGHHST